MIEFANNFFEDGFVDFSDAEQEEFKATIRGLFALDPLDSYLAPGFQVVFKEDL